MYKQICMKKIIFILNCYEVTGLEVLLAGSTSIINSILAIIFCSLEQINYWPIQHTVLYFIVQRSNSSL